MNVLATKIVPSNPWRRFFARLVDYLLFYWLVDAVLNIVYNNINSDAYYVSLIIGFLYIPVESTMLTLFATTIGKFIFGLKVKTLSSDKIAFRMALKRSFLVLLKGMAIGLPIVNLVAMLIAYSRLKETGSTLWDAEVQTKVIRT